MDDLFRTIKDKLLITENMYDYMRIIDPINKNIINLTSYGAIELKGKCFQNFNRNTFCENCISMRAYNENDTYLKVENTLNKVNLVISTPFTMDEKDYIVEIIKDISKGNHIEVDNEVSMVINNINNKIIKDRLTDVYNNNYVEERLPIDINSSIKENYLLSIIIIEIENINSLKDKYDEKIINMVIKNFAEKINKLIDKNSCWLGKYKDDKFIVALNKLDQEKTKEIFIQLKICMNEFSFEHNLNNINLETNIKLYSNEDDTINIEKILRKFKINSVDEEKKNKESFKNEMELSKLSYRIEELRKNLNEMYISIEGKRDYSKTLKMSQDLDKLIVEYMKNMTV